MGFSADNEQVGLGESDTDTESETEENVPDTEPTTPELPTD
jgi:hypothetical protein